jgi:predicted Rossmann fold nucleotide-binding protein DprA/Smf involved in DNA uptake
MADILTQVTTAIETRLREIGDEKHHLERILAGLDGRGSSRRGRQPSPTRRRRASRAPRGQRQQQFLEAVKKTPGAPIAQVAREMKVPPQQLYAVARRLRDQGQIRKRGRGYAVKT